MNSITVIIAVLVLLAIADSGTANAQAQRWNRIAELPADPPLEMPTSIEILNDSTTLIGTAVPSLLLLHGSSVVWEMRFDTTKLPHLNYPSGWIVDILSLTDSTVLLAFQFGHARTVNILNRTTQELHFRPINDLARSGDGTIVASARFRSTDNGVSWDTIKDEKVTSQYFNDLAGGPNDNFYGTPESSGLWRSTDGGITWIEREALRQTSDSLTGAGILFVYDEKTVVVSAGNFRTIEGKNNGLYKTTDDGQTWRSVLRTDSAYVLMSAQDGNLAFVTMAKPKTDVTHTYTSTDFGETWSLVDEGFPKRIGLGAMATRGGKTLLAVTHLEGQSLYRLDAVSSVAMPNNRPMHGLHISPNPVVRNGSVVIEISGADKGEVVVSNSYGSIVAQLPVEKTTSTQRSVEMDLRGVVPGFYMIELRGEQPRMRAKLIVAE